MAVRQWTGKRRNGETVGRPTMRGEAQVARKRRKRKDPPPSDSHAWLKVLVMGLVALLGGLALAITSAVYKWHLSEKADRLRAEGVPVTASVSNFYNASGRGGGADTIDVHYSYGGANYQARILCGGLTGCHETPAPEMTVWVDPVDPEQFLGDNGHTDDAVSFFNSYATIPAGLVFALMGGVALAVTVSANRQRVGTRKQRR